ncbi:MAG TPA: hypothetical protein VMU75_03475 [Acidimicrobiales bacterium]|nr:hypothetical protein [Acidimicrobiales bacterium]
MGYFAIRFQPTITHIAPLLGARRPGTVAVDAIGAGALAVSSEGASGR